MMNKVMWMVAAGAMALAGCGGDDKVGPRDGGAVVDKAIMIVTRVEGPEGRTYYLHVVPDFPASGKLDAAAAVELGASADAIAFDGVIYSGTDDRMIRYDVADDLTVTRGPALSVAATGALWAAASSTAWASPTRAHLVEFESGLIVTFDPSTMTLIGTTEIPAAVLERDGFGPGVFQQPRVFGNYAYTTAYWRDWDLGTSYAVAATGRFRVDTDTPVFEVLEDPRCAVTMAAAPFSDADGNVYVAGDWASGYDLLARDTPTATTPQCLLRIKPGAAGFDPDFFVDLSALSGAPAFYAAHPMPGRRLLLNKWSASIDPAELRDPQDPYWYWDAQAFDWTLVDLDAGTATPVRDLPLGGAQDTRTLTLDGVNYVQIYDEARGATLYRVTGEGEVTEVLRGGAGVDFQWLGRLR
jgi:hypothetical protein